MVEHGGHRSSQHQLLDRRDHRQRGVELHVPAACLHALDGGREARAADIRIADAAGGEIDATAAKTVRLHCVELGFRGLVVDHGHSACGRAARLHAEQGGGIVGAVDARRHDHHALDMQRLVQRRHFLGACRFRRIDAPREERKLFDVTMDVRVAIAGMGRNVEIDRRRGLRRTGVSFVGHGYSGGKGGKQDAASVEHGFSPASLFGGGTGTVSHQPGSRSASLHSCSTRSASGREPSMRTTGQGRPASQASSFVRLRPSRSPAS